ncbi:MAG: glutaredoxin family protein [Mycobacteriales bacterium]
MSLLTRAGCHLCDEARTELAEICSGEGITFEERDVDADSQLAAAYSDYVPVILVNDRVVGCLRVEAARVRAALAEIE